MQHINLILGASLLLLHLAVLIFRKTGEHYLTMHRSTGMVLELVSLLWLALPFLVGGAAVAEERKLGMLESLLCLPVRRRREFVVKFAMALVLGAFLGGVMPCFMERVGSRMGLSSSGGFAGEFWLHQDRAFIAGAATLVAAGITLLSFYASALTRNLLQALGLGAIFCTAAGLISLAVGALAREQFGLLSLWSEPLAALVLCPLMAVAVLLLSWGNFRQLQIGSLVWFRNISRLLGALLAGAVVTTFVYHRVWEIWTPDEPAHGFTNPLLLEWREGVGRRPGITKMESARARLAIVLRDGRLWLRQGHLKYIKRAEPGRRIRTAGPWRSGFVPGRDWRDVAVSESRAFAIQTDGSVWDLSDVKFGRDGIASGAKPFGQDHDWKGISVDGEHVLALKTNGTLWEWGSRLSIAGTNVVVVKMSVPVQVGPDADWIAIRSSGERMIALKSDGTFWMWGLSYNRENPIIQQPTLWLAGPPRMPVSLCFDGFGVALVYDDGSVWIGRDNFYASRSERRIPQVVRRGDDSQWWQVKLVGGRAVALKRDGSLCQLRWTAQEPAPDIAPSSYSDWVAIGSSAYSHTYFALAADGTVCEWVVQDAFRELRGSTNWRTHPADDTLLAPSRVKARKIADLTWLAR